MTSKSTSPTSLSIDDPPYPTKPHDLSTEAISENNNKPQWFNVHELALIAYFLQSKQHHHTKMASPNCSGGDQITDISNHGHEPNNTTAFPLPYHNTNNNTTNNTNNTTNDTNNTTNNTNNDTNNITTNNTATTNTNKKNFNNLDIVDQRDHMEALQFYMINNIPCIVNHIDTRPSHFFYSFNIMSNHHETNNPTEVSWPTNWGLGDAKCDGEETTWCTLVGENELHDSGGKMSSNCNNNTTTNKISNDFYEKNSNNNNNNGEQNGDDKVICTNAPIMQQPTYFDNPYHSATTAPSNIVSNGNYASFDEMKQDDGSTDGYSDVRSNELSGDDAQGANTLPNTLSTNFTIPKSLGPPNSNQESLYDVLLARFGEELNQKLKKVSINFDYFCQRYGNSEVTISDCATRDSNSQECDDSLLCEYIDEWKRHRKYTHDLFFDQNSQKYNRISHDLSQGNFLEHEEDVNADGSDETSYGGNNKPFLKYCRDWHLSVDHHNTSLPRPSLYHGRPPDGEITSDKEQLIASSLKDKKQPVEFEHFYSPPLCITDDCLNLYWDYLTMAHHYIHKKSIKNQAEILKNENERQNGDENCHNLKPNSQNSHLTQNLQNLQKNQIENFHQNQPSQNSPITNTTQPNTFNNTITVPRIDNAITTVPRIDNAVTTVPRIDDYRFVYFGPYSSFTPLHRDVYSSYSWSGNVVGIKLWIFLPPNYVNLTQTNPLSPTVDLYDVFNEDLVKISSQKNQKLFLNGENGSEKNENLDTESNFSTCPNLSKDSKESTFSNNLTPSLYSSLQLWIKQLRQTVLECINQDDSVGADNIGVPQQQHQQQEEHNHQQQQQRQQQQQQEHNHQQQHQHQQQHPEPVILLQFPGDLVFVPSFWAHQVVNLTDCISINHNWGNSFNLNMMTSQLLLDNITIKASLGEYKTVTSSITEQVDEINQKIRAKYNNDNFEHENVSISPFLFEPTHLSADDSSDFNNGDVDNDDGDYNVNMNGDTATNNTTNTTTHNNNINNKNNNKDGCIMTTKTPVNNEDDITKRLHQLWYLDNVSTKQKNAPNDQSLQGNKSLGIKCSGTSGSPQDHTPSPISPHQNMPRQSILSSLSPHSDPLHTPLQYKKFALKQLSSNDGTMESILQTYATILNIPTGFSIDNAHSDNGVDVKINVKCAESDKNAENATLNTDSPIISMNTLGDRAKLWELTTSDNGDFDYDFCQIGVDSSRPSCENNNRSLSQIDHFTLNSNNEAQIKQFSTCNVQILDFLAQYYCQIDQYVDKTNCYIDELNIKLKQDHFQHQRQLQIEYQKKLAEANNQQGGGSMGDNLDLINTEKQNTSNKSIKKHSFSISSSAPKITPPLSLKHIVKTNNILDDIITEQRLLRTNCGMNLIDLYQIITINQFSSISYLFIIFDIMVDVVDSFNIQSDDETLKFDQYDNRTYFDASNKAFSHSKPTCIQNNSSISIDSNQSRLPDSQKPSENITALSRLVENFKLNITKAFQDSEAFSESNLTKAFHHSEDSSQTHNSPNSSHIHDVYFNSCDVLKIFNALYTTHIDKLQHQYSSYCQCYHYSSYCKSYQAPPQNPSQNNPDLSLNLTESDITTPNIENGTCINKVDADLLFGHHFDTFEQRRFYALLTYISEIKFQLEYNNNKITKEMRIDIINTLSRYVLHVLFFMIESNHCIERLHNETDFGLLFTIAMSMVKDQFDCNGGSGGGDDDDEVFLYEISTQQYIHNKDTSSNCNQDDTNAKYSMNFNQDHTVSSNDNHRDGETLSLLKSIYHQFIYPCSAPTTKTSSPPSSSSLLSSSNLLTDSSSSNITYNHQCCDRVSTTKIVPFIHIGHFSTQFSILFEHLFYSFLKLTIPIFGKDIMTNNVKLCRKMLRYLSAQ